MSPTYTATIHDGRIEWDGTPPPTNGGPLRVQVTPIDLHAPFPEEKRQRIAELLDQLVANGAAQEFGEAVEWQREQRRDTAIS